MVLRLTAAHIECRTHGVVSSYQVMGPEKWY